MESLTPDDRPPLELHEDHLSREYELLIYDCRPWGEVEGCGPDQRVTAAYEGEQYTVDDGPRAGQLAGSVSPVYRCGGCGRQLGAADLYAMRRAREQP